MEKKETFKYTYSAAEQEEIKNIRKKYAAPETGEDRTEKMQRLRQMDRRVTDRASAKSLALGVPGALIMGSGMSLVMTDLGAALGISETPALIAGIITGTIGMAMAGLAYPVYNRTLKKERAKAAPEILQLTEELME